MTLNLHTRVRLSRGIGLAAALFASTVACAADGNPKALPHGHSVRQLLVAQRLHETALAAGQRPMPSLDGAAARHIMLQYRESFRQGSGASAGSGLVADGMPSAVGTR